MDFVFYIIKILLIVCLGYKKFWNHIAIFIITGLLGIIDSVTQYMHGDIIGLILSVIVAVVSIVRIIIFIKEWKYKRAIY